MFTLCGQCGFCVLLSTVLPLSIVRKLLLGSFLFGKLRMCPSLAVETAFKKK